MNYKSNLVKGDTCKKCKDYSKIKLECFALFYTQYFHLWLWFVFLTVYVQWFNSGSF